MKKKSFILIIIFFIWGNTFAQNSMPQQKNDNSKLAKDVPAEIPFFDNFDDADISDYINLGGTTFTGTSTTFSVFGGNSLYINGGTFGSGLTRTVATPPTKITAYVMTPSVLTPTDVSTYIEYKDTDGGVIFFFAITGDKGPAVTGNFGSFVGLGTFTPNQWYFVEFDVDYNNAEFTFSVDGNIIGTFNYKSSTTGAGETIDLHNWGGFEGYWDEIYAYAPATTPAPPTVSDIIGVCPNTMQKLGTSEYVNWWDSAVGGSVVDFSDTLKVSLGNNDTTFYASSVILESNHISIESGSESGVIRGYYFTAPTNFNISSLHVPLNQSGYQTIEVVRFTNGNPPEYPTVTNDFESLGFWPITGANDSVFCNIPVTEGDIIGIYGYRNQNVSYGDSQYKTHIMEFPVTLYRSGMDALLADGTQMQDIWSDIDNPIGIIQFSYTAAESDRVANNIFVENESPIISCPTNQIVSAVSEYTVVGQEFDLLSSIDNCEIEYIINDFNSSASLVGALLPIGDNTITWTAADFAGNTATCSFIVTVNQTVNINKINAENISIFPNPSKGNVTLDNIKGYNIQISDLAGKLIKEFNNVSEKSLTIDFTSYPQSVYLIKFTNKDIVKIKKIIIQ